MRTYNTHYKDFDSLSSFLSENINVAEDYVTQAIKGSISCESEEGKGKTFIIAIPARE